MTTRFRQALFLLGLSAVGVTSLGSGTAAAQVANCPFNVAANGAPKFAIDGLILLRYAVGFRGTNLSVGVAPGVNLASAESNITANLSRLDVDADDAFTPVDALIIGRYLAGYSQAAWASGITFAGNAQRKNGTDLQLFMTAGCPAPVTSFVLKDAARLLQQGTWGATLPEINRVQGVGVNGWLNEQFALPATSYTTYAAALIAANKNGANGCTNSNGCPWAANTPGFYKQAFEGNDQLRQRVVNALLQILVVSTGNNRVLDAGTGMANYMDMLGAQAFGNFRTLLRDVTLHPAMGVYLDMLGSAQENPNENYARELLQLFSVGTVMLNADGTPQSSGGQLIPTYTEAVVQGFSKAFTGWHFRDQPEATEPWRFYWPNEDWTQPMKPWAGRRCPQDGRWPAGSTTQWCSVSDPLRSYPPPHHTGTKMLLQYSGAPYATLPANQTAQLDVENAIDNIFNHPNVGPFIGRQLIQRLVTSNPSPAYVGRVTAAFNNNGATPAVRGDMKAVVRAILMDNEARDGFIAANNIFGKLREPVIKFLHLHRAFGAIASGGYYDVWDLGDTDTLNQAALRAPSVFNYYSPDFEPAGPMKTAFLQGPEFEITSTSSVAGFSDFTGWGVVGGFRQYDADTAKWFKPNYDRYLIGAAGVALADNPQALVDELDLLLTANNLKPAFKANLVSMVTNITRTNVADQRRDRFRAVMWQIIHSADYAVQR